MAASSSPKASSVSNVGVVKDMRSASVAVLRKTAQDVFQSKTVSLDSNPTPEDRLPKFDARELSIGRVLGRGAFCVVNECSISNASGNLSMESGSSRGSFLGRFNSVVSISGRQSNHLNRRSNDSHANVTTGGSDNEGDAARSDTGVNLTRQNRKKSRSRYVVKQLSPELKHGDKINFLKGMVDLAMETRFLASFDHDNIISVHGVSSKSAFAEGYFIILEKVNDTLGKRVKKWMDMDRQCKGITGVFTGSKKKLLRLDTERLLAAYDLAIGMNYLHERNIVFRDLVSTLPVGCIVCVGSRRSTQVEANKPYSTRIMDFSRNPTMLDLTMLEC
jgi:serine/threonine protein kinase